MIQQVMGGQNDEEIQKTNPFRKQVKKECSAPQFHFTSGTKQMRSTLLFFCPKGLIMTYQAYREIAGCF